MTRAVGVDISKWDSTFNPTSFVEFVIMRSSYGVYPDVKFEEYYPNSLKVKVRGAYHYLTSSPSWKSQADKFLSLVANKKLHFYVCDLEEYGNIVDRTYCAMAMEWMKYVKDQTGKPVVLYTNYSLYSYVINAYEKQRALLYPLWIAQYYYEFKNYQTKSPRLPEGRDKWDIWQFLPGEWGQFGYEAGVGRDGVDTNVYNGTLNEMMKQFNISNDDTNEPEPPVAPKYPMQLNIKAYSINIREKPSTSSKTMGGLVRGNTIFISGIEKDIYGNIWGKLSEGKYTGNYVALKWRGYYYTTWREE